jgi:hypothetical protein
MNEISEEEDKFYEIYKITNKIDGKAYIGLAKKWIKMSRQKYYIYGGIGRFKRHISNSISKNEKLSKDCPSFYDAIRKYGSSNFELEILKIINDNIHKNEEDEIIKYKTHDPDYGYNILLSTKKPLTQNRLLNFTKVKEIGNKNRAVNGEMRKKEHNKNLPPNIYYRFTKNDKDEIIHEGYFVQIKTNGKLKNKAFLSDKLTLEDKLTKAKEYLASINIELNVEQNNILNI